MPAIPTYSLISHAPATARTQLATTCRYARYAEIHPVQPLKGLRETRVASVSYRAFVPAGHDGCGVALSYQALSPDGETLPSGIKGSLFVLPQPTPNSQLLTPNSQLISPTYILSNFAATQLSFDLWSTYFRPFWAQQ